jgi:RHS repeat-associated protein
MGTSTGTTAHWLLYDLLGSVVASQAAGSGTTSIVDALRYDAYGQTLGQHQAAGSDLGPRFRGLLDLAPTADRDVTGAGADPLYQMGARAYAPHLGTFTKLDTYAGRAQAPISLNRYLYAHANPATLIDPSGHCTTARSCPDGGQQTPDPEPVCSSSACKDTTPTGGGNTGGGGGGGGGGTSSTGNGNSGGAVPPPMIADIPVSQTGMPYNQADADKLNFVCIAGDGYSPSERNAACGATYLWTHGDPTPPTDMGELFGFFGCLAPMVGGVCDAKDLGDAVYNGDVPGVAVGLASVFGAGPVKRIGQRALEALGLVRRAPKIGDLDYLGDIVRRQVGNNDPSAHALARRLGGDKGQLGFSGLNPDIEFDAITDRYIASAKHGTVKNERLRAQFRRIFEAARDTGRTPYFQFDVPINEDMRHLLERYKADYGLAYELDTVPLELEPGDFE